MDLGPRSATFSWLVMESVPAHGFLACFKRRAIGAIVLDLEA